MDENLQDGAETIISDEVVDTQDESTSGDEATTDLAEELEKARKAISQLTARAKKAEDEVKKSKVSDNTKAQPNINNVLSREEAFLIAKGYETPSCSIINWKILPPWPQLKHLKIPLLGDTLILAFLSS